MSHPDGRLRPNDTVGRCHTGRTTVTTGAIEHQKRATSWQPTPSRSLETSQKHQNCVSPRAVRPSPTLVSPSIDAGRTARPTSGKRPRRLDQRSWDGPEGDRRSKVEIVADEVAPSLRWATAALTKNERIDPGGQNAGGSAAAPPPVSAPPAGYDYDEEPF